MSTALRLRADNPITWLGGLLVLVLMGTAAARWQGWQAQTPTLAVQQELSLRFGDTPEGDVVVLDAHTAQRLAVYSGEQGFLRGTLRALVRERRRWSADSDAPFVLRRLSDASLLLLDPVSGQHILLDSFGPSNKAVFARLLPDTAVSSSRVDPEGTPP